MAAVVDKLSDAELYQKLVEIGVTDCAVSPVTRKLLIRKYGEQLSSQCSVSKGQNTRRSHVQLGFSSDEGEDFENVKSSGRVSSNHKVRHKAAASNVNSRRSTSPVDEDFKKPALLSRKSTRRSMIQESPSSSPFSFGNASNGGIGRRRSRRTRSSNAADSVFDMNISDSDSDLNSVRSNRLHNSHLSDSPSTWSWRRKTEQNSSAGPKSNNNNIFGAQSTSERQDALSGFNKPGAHNHGSATTEIHTLNDETESRIAEITEAISNDKGHYDRYLSRKHEKASEMFSSQDKSGNSSRNHHHPHTVSSFILAIAVVFFIAIGFFYLIGIKQWTMSDIIDNNLLFSSHTNNKYHIDTGTNLSEIDGICLHSDCVHPSRAKFVLKCSRALLQELAIIAGKYECNEMVASRSITKRQALNFFETFDMEDDMRSREVLNDVLILFLKNKVKWEIRLLSKEMEEKLYFPQEVWWLQSKFPLKSFKCRLKIALLSVFLRTFLVAAGAVMIFLLYKLHVYRKSKQEEHKNKVYDLAEDIIGIIKKNHMQYKVMEHADEISYIPVTHVRDILIPLTDRVKMRSVWDDACKVVEDHESRVRVEYHTVAGEDNKVWGWFENSLNGESNSKVWQGRAFENDISGINALSCSMTSCLKIRNMFSPDKDKESGWETAVIDAVMEKCGDNHQIVHIAIANDASIPEGCVYVKFTNNTAAGQAYKALHGCWFDGKLVTVKFLRLERYHEHYPEAVGLTTSLKPSNNLKLSLSHDGLFSTNEVLERS